MKNYFFVLLALFSLSATHGQKFGYIDTEDILVKVPEYQEAQKEIDKISVVEQQKIEKMYISLDSMYNAYRLEEVFLTEEMKQKRQAQIVDKEKEIKNYQKKIFGFEGRIFLKRQELIQPIQDQIMEAVEKVAKKHKLQIIFDKSGDVNMVYTNPTHDYTDFVLEELGLGDPDDQVDNERHQEK